jgi:ABC-type transporter Mla subunit MlaD
MAHPGSGSAPQSGVQLSLNDLKDGNKFSSIVSALEQYSQSLVKNFEATTRSLHQRLDETAGVATQALAILSQSESELEALLGASFADLDAIIGTVEGLADDFNGLNSIENELCLLSDQVTTLEDAVRRRQ